MTTTFQNRELVRDELVALFTADGSWQSVYNHFPGISDIVPKRSVLIVRANGTEQQMSGQVQNRTRYNFQCDCYVLADDPANNWSGSNAEDELDKLDQVFRQVIRDNAGGGTNYDLLTFEDGFSQVADIVADEGTSYIRETRNVIATLVNGTV